MRETWGIVLVAVLSWSCGSSSSPSGDAPDASNDGARDATLDGNGVDAMLADGGGGPLRDASADGAACGPAACSGVAGACGTFLDPCAQVVSCEPCRFTHQMVAPAISLGSPALVSLAVGAHLVVASAPVNVSTLGDAGWQTEAAVPMGGGRGLDLALAADGTPWLVYINTAAGSYELHVAHKSGATWMDESLGVSTAAAIGIADDGTPNVAYTGLVTGMLGGKYGTVVARFTGGAWARQLLKEEMSGAEAVDIAMQGNTAHVAWHDIASLNVEYAAVGATPGPIEVVDNVSGSGEPVSLSIAVDPQGRPHLAYYPYRDMRHAFRDGTWSHESIPAGGEGGGTVRVATSPTGQVAVGWTTDVGIGGVGYAFLANGFAPQTLLARCDGSMASMDMAFDRSGALLFAHTCSSEVALLTQTGIYPVGYTAACTALGTTLCAEACACPRDHNSDCCLHRSDAGTDGNGACNGPESYCATHTQGIMCGDATQDPAPVFSCKDMAGGLACTPDGGTGVVLPGACVPLFP